MLKKSWFWFIFLLLLTACGADRQAPPDQKKAEILPSPFYSSFNDSLVRAFDSQKRARHDSAYQSGISVCYGQVWAESMAATIPEGDSISLLHQFKAELDDRGLQGDSLHCTLYAQELLALGLGEAEQNRLDSLHKRIWKDREYAGWSVGYLLVRDFGWRAIQVIDSASGELAHCDRAWKNDSVYPVWEQPAIPLAQRLIRGRDETRLDSLLAEERFAWGFSDQGLHTWVLLGSQLHECNWTGAPSLKYELVGNRPLFIQTPFQEWWDYQSHVLIFPPK